VLAEVAQLELIAEEIACRLRDKDLPAVGGCHDAGRTVHVDSNVPLFGDKRFAGVESHSHLHRGVEEGALCFGGGGEPV
jgi:hypothetical protein